MTISLALLAAMMMAPPPEVPRAVQTIVENNRFVLRSLIGAKPLYTFDRDTPGKSNCNDACAEAWPPLTAPAGAKPVGKWTVVVRADKSSQWAFGGKPVYMFAKDAEGTPSGDGAGGVWHLLPTTPYK